MRGRGQRGEKSGARGDVAKEPEALEVSLAQRHVMLCGDDGRVECGEID